MKRALQILIAMILLVAVSASMGCGRWLIVRIAQRVAEPAAVAPPSGVAVERDIVFAETKDGPLALDIYTPDPRPPGKLPVVVFVYGGGWFVGNKNQVQLLDGPLLARRGFAVVSTSYRLTDVAIFPAQIHDVKATIRWVRANAEHYGFEASAIGAWGGSAGGHLVSLLATTPGVAALEGDVGGEALRGYDSHVQAVVDYFGPADLLKFSVDPGWMVEDLLGGPFADRRALAKLASPAHHVSRDVATEIAPLLIVHGDRDRTVPVEQSTSFHARLASAGADSTLHVIAGAGHGGEEFVTEEMHEKIVAFFGRHLIRP